MLGPVSILKAKHMKPTLNQKGFTIVELLVVIVVIGILAAIAVVSYGGIRERAHATSIQSELSQINKGLGMYKATYGAYPDTGSGNSYSCYDAEYWTLLSHLEEFMSSVPSAPCGVVTGINDTWVYSSNGSEYKLLHVRPENSEALKKHTPEALRDPVRWDSDGSWGYWSSGWSSQLVGGPVN